MSKLNDGFKGKGSLATFIKEVVKLFTAVNNAEVLVPVGSSGKEPTLRIEGEKLTLDLSETVISAGAGGAGGSGSGLPPGGTDGMVIQRNSDLEAVWDFVRLVAPPSP